MSEAKSISGNTSAAMLRTMVGIGAICGLLIVLVYEGTRPRIEQLRKEALQQAIFKVVPGTTSTQAFQWNGEEFVLENQEDIPTIYAGFDDSGELKGVAIPASGQGYADVIRILYGYDPASQQVIGFYVLESKETPGLGDKIEKDADFLSNFEALDVTLNAAASMLLHEIVPVKRGSKTESWQVDGITGATISSRAIGNILGESTRTWVPRIYQHKKTLTNHE